MSQRVCTSKTSDKPAKKPTETKGYVCKCFVITSVPQSVTSMTWDKPVKKPSETKGYVRKCFVIMHVPQSVTSMTSDKIEEKKPSKTKGYVCKCFVYLFDLLHHIHSKQLRSCQDGQLLNHTVPGQASRRQLSSSKCPFFHQY